MSSKYFPQFCYYLPVGKGHGCLFLKNIPMVKDQCFVQRSVKIGLVVLQKSKTLKVYRLTDGQTDKQQAIRKAHLSFHLT